MATRKHKKEYEDEKEDSLALELAKTLAAGAVLVGGMFAFLVGAIGTGGFIIAAAPAVVDAFAQGRKGPPPPMF